MNCAECGRYVDMSNNPPSDTVWCGRACLDAWCSVRPEEAAKWTAVSALNAVQLAELAGMLGEGGKA